METEDEIEIIKGDAIVLGAVDEIMQSAFNPIYGEAWTLNQCNAILGMPGTWLFLAEERGNPLGFALTRSGGGDAELLLLAVHKSQQKRGIGEKLLRAVIEEVRQRNIERLFLEVRSCNSAISVYRKNGFIKTGERRDYYRGKDGSLYDAHSYRMIL